MRTEKSYVLDPADMECGENREVYSTRISLRLAKNLAPTSSMVLFGKPIRRTSLTYSN